MSVATETPSAESQAPQAGGPTPEQMAMWQKIAAPGAAHDVLKPVIGTFRAEVTFFMPGMPDGQCSQGTMVNSSVLGGRYVEMRYQGDGDCMQGIGFVGYDNVKRKYTGLWMDTMSTQIMVSEGSIDAAGKVITQECDVECPMQGKQHMRTVTTIVDENRHT